MKHEATWHIPSPIKWDACPLQCPPLPVSLIVCQYTVILGRGIVRASVRVSQDGAVVWGFVLYCCDLGAIPKPWITCGLSFLLFFSHYSKGFYPGPLVFLSIQKPMFQISTLLGNRRQKEPLDLFSKI